MFFPRDLVTQHHLRGNTLSFAVSSSAYAQAQLQATNELMIDGQYVVGPVTSWLTSFVEWADNTTEYRCATTEEARRQIY